MTEFSFLGELYPFKSIKPLLSFCRSSWTLCRCECPPDSGGVWLTVPPKSMYSLNIDRRNERMAGFGVFSLLFVLTNIESTLQRNAARGWWAAGASHKREIKTIPRRTKQEKQTFLW